MITAAGKVIDFFPEDKNNKNEKNRRTTTTTTCSTSSSTARARMSVSRNPDSSQRLYQMFVNVVQYYENSFGRKAGISLQTDVRDAILKGMTDDVLIACLVKAEEAPMPSWGYARAIMRRCLSEGVLTAEQWEADQAARKKQRTKKDAGFMQRNYTMADFEQGFFANIDEK